MLAGSDQEQERMAQLNQAQLILLLIRLHETLAKNQQAALTQSVAISGLGGIGKTQTATEYAYRYRNDYQHIFWVKAETRQELLGDLASSAHSLVLAEPQQQNQTA